MKLQRVVQVVVCAVMVALAIAGEATNAQTTTPFFIQQEKLLAVDGVDGDSLGNAVALDGDTLVAGAPEADIGGKTDEGSVYVYTRSGGVWSLQQKITAFDGTANLRFGAAVALHGNTLAVGDPGGYSFIGSVYVYTRSGGTWSLQQKITAFDGAADDQFGAAVALSDYTLVVGAPRANIGANLDQGAVYVYTRIGTVWSLQKKIIATAGGASEFFGQAVALDNDTLAVGAPDEGIGANSGQGSAHIFRRYGTIWLQEAKLTANDGAAYDSFGNALALSGDTLIVGAVFDDIGANKNQGSAYVFTRSGTTWMQQQNLIAADGGFKDFFGGNVALNGDILAIGASGNDSGANKDQGAVYIFTRSNGGWNYQEKLTASDGATNDFFGSAVALSGDTLAVGAAGVDVGTSLNRGSAYVFVRPPCPDIQLAPSNLLDSVVGTLYQQQITASGGSGSYQFAFANGTLPPGLSLTSSGLLSGTPTTPGTYYFAISATDSSSGCFGASAYIINVTLPCPTLTINPPTLPNSLTGKPYSQTLTVTGGVGPYKFAVKGKLPLGLSLSVNGVLSGIPTQMGQFGFAALVTDANGCTGSRIYSITITHP